MGKIVGATEAGAGYWDVISNAPPSIIVRTNLAGSITEWSSSNETPSTNSFSGPLELVIYMHSPLPAYRKTRSAVMVFSFDLPNAPYYIVGNAAGYYSFEILSPCRAEDADSEKPVLKSDFELPASEVRINRLGAVGGRLRTLDFELTADSKLGLQASSDLKNWTSIYPLSGKQGTNTWTSPEPLETKGQFFRLFVIPEF